MLRIESPSIVLMLVIALTAACGGSSGGPQSPSASSGQPTQTVSESPSGEDQPLQSSPVDSASVTTAIADISVDEIEQTRASRRGKPLLINYWATFCGPCKKEMPHLVDLYEEHRGEVDFLAISIDGLAGTEDAIPETMEQLGMTLATRLLVTDRNMNDTITALDPQWGGTLPATFIYNASGEVIHRMIGEQTRQQFESALANVLPGETG